MPNKREPKDVSPLESAFQFVEIGGKLEETNLLLQALIWDIRALPQQMAQHMVIYLAQHLRHGHLNNGTVALTYMQQLVKLLNSGKPYLVLVWRISLLTGLISLMAKGTYSARELADALRAALLGP